MSSSASLWKRPEKSSSPDLAEVRRDHDHPALREPDEQVAVPEPHVAHDAAVLGLEGELHRVLRVRAVVQQDRLAAHVRRARIVCSGCAPGSVQRRGRRAVRLLRCELDCDWAYFSSVCSIVSPSALEASSRRVCATERERVVTRPVSTGDCAAVLAQRSVASCDCPCGRSQVRPCSPQSQAAAPFRPLGERSEA